MFDLVQISFTGRCFHFWPSVTWYLTVFPKKLKNKTFYFYTKKNIALLFFTLVLALESISGVKS
jgi:hypothetical protein